MLLVGWTLEVAANLGVLDVVFLWDRVARVGILGDGERLHLQFFMSAFQHGEETGWEGRRTWTCTPSEFLRECGTAIVVPLWLPIWLVRKAMGPFERDWWPVELGGISQLPTLQPVSCRWYVQDLRASVGPPVEATDRAACHNL